MGHTQKVPLFLRLWTIFIGTLFRAAHCFNVNINFIGSTNIDKKCYINFSSFVEIEIWIWGIGKLVANSVVQFNLIYFWRSLLSKVMRDMKA